MDVNELAQWLTEGLPADQAAIVTAQINKDANKARILAVKKADEYAAIETRAAALQKELEGEGDAKPGTRAYQKWYQDNFAAIQQLQTDRAAYEAKFGKLDGTPPPNPQTPPANTMTAADIQREVDKRINEGYAPKWSDLITGSGTILERHIRSGRKNSVDWKAIGDLAPKYGGNMVQAYEEWDKPESDKAKTASDEAEVNRRVEAELQKRGASTQFPAGADLTPGTLSNRTRTETEKFDKTALQRDLAATWNTAGSTQ